MIKHGLVLDLSFVEWLDGNIEKLRTREPDALIYAVRRCCELKAAVVAADERESGVRALLNFGHTFGHAIEAGTGYGTWLHGEAIAAGMVMAAELSHRAGLIARADLQRVRSLLSRAGLPVSGPAIPAQRMLELMSVDKKAARGQTRFVLLQAIGRAVLKGDVSPGLVSEAILAAVQ